MDVDNIMVAIAAWSSADDWQVPTIMTDTVREILTAVNAGISPNDIAAHAKHVPVHGDCTNACTDVVRLMGRLTTMLVIVTLAWLILVAVGRSLK